MRSSYVHGTDATPLLGETIGAMFDPIAAEHADREALAVCEQNVRWSYGELEARVDAFPTTITGKVQKYKMREQMVHELGLEKSA